MICPQEMLNVISDVLAELSDSVDVELMLCRLPPEVNARFKAWYESGWLPGSPHADEAFHNSYR